MKTVQISLNSIDKVKSFVNAITQFEFDFDLISGRYVIDAKSIMGIFSLDLSKPIDLAIHAESNMDEIRYCLLFLFYPSMWITSTVSMASCINASIFSLNFLSSLWITFKFGFVTGCFATKMVQQSSYGRMDVSYASIFSEIVTISCLSNPMSGR